jgi:hypothetical protein
VRLLLAILALAVSGCAHGVTLPPLPAWVQPAGATEISAARVAAEARAMIPGVQIGSFGDSTYTLVSRSWLDAFLTWTWHAGKAAGITYTPESFDCEDFAALFGVMAGLSASKAGVKAKPLTPIAVVEWSATERHAMVAVATDQGPVIVEPNPAGGAFRVWPLATYPKRIRSLDFGPINPL